ncbi:hypothetical protein H9Y04_18105 [Streptomyces sp. TRM66268-LWL]|uniref:Uncharacterized protein n=1 Tax=Streptomyces polyasparticus TaxID=2767826 RepID=A0ABR7SIR7_9ACTN|nr:hypothetical protein [Streptomyces polyasparticus]MBC9714477.1 hypothetical protein [Streptomyces polyasparticus]
MEVLEEKVTALRKDGEKISDAAGDVHVTFGGLSAFYEAPEAEQLFATTLPVVGAADSLHLDVSDVASALGDYADTVRPLKNRLEQLTQEAIAFRDMTIADPDWREDGDLIDENEARRTEIGKVWGQFMEAEVACQNAIVALVGGTGLKMNGKPGQKGYYGYTGDVLSQVEELPWGKPVEESVPWYQSYEHVGNFFTGFVIDGGWATIKGLGTLVGVDGWDKAGEAWTGLGKLATGLALVANPLTAGAFLLTPDDKLPSWVRDSRTALKETGKAMVAWDQWDTQPGRAAGATTFNVITTVFTGGTGAGLSAAGKAGLGAKAAAMAGKIAKFSDPVSLTFTAGFKAGTKVSELMAGLKNMGYGKLPTGVIELPEGAVHHADGTVGLPEGAAAPKGLTPAADGTYRVPKGVDAVPVGAIPDPRVKGVYLRPDGAIINGRGAVLSHLDETLPEPGKNRLGNADEANVIGRVDDHVLVGAGARAEAGATIPARAEAAIPDARMDLETGGGTRGAGPGGPADSATGGGTRGVGSGGADDLARGSSGGHEPPAGARRGGSGGGLLDDLGRPGDDAVSGGDGLDSAPEGGADAGSTPSPDEPRGYRPDDEPDFSRPALPPGRSEVTLGDIRNTRHWEDRWRGGQDYFRDIYGGSPERHYPVPENDHPLYPVSTPGGRYVDVPVDMPGGRTLGVEVKTYLNYRTITLDNGSNKAVKNEVPLNAHMKQEIHKDLALRRMDPKFDPRWVFTHGGPSPALRKYLTDARIIFVEYGPHPKKN